MKGGRVAKSNLKSKDAKLTLICPEADLFGRASNHKLIELSPGVLDIGNRFNKGHYCPHIMLIDVYHSISNKSAWECTFKANEKFCYIDSFIRETCFARQ